MHKLSTHVQLAWSSRLSRF